MLLPSAFIGCARGNRLLRFDPRLLGTYPGYKLVLAVDFEQRTT